MPVNMIKPQKSLLSSMRAASVASFGEWRKYAALLILLSLTNACSQPADSEALFRHYQQELATLKGTQSTPPAKADFIAMPRSSDLRQEIDRVSIGLLDSMQLDKCRAGGLIAQRNSALGKMQSPSARLRYELDSLMALAECKKSQVADDARIDELLTAAIEHKQKTLPHYIDRALATGDEVRHALRPATRMLPQQNDGHVAAITALTYITETLNQAINAPNAWFSLERYNRHFRTLAQSQFLPRYWRTQLRTQGWMHTLNRTLTAFSQSPVCAANWQKTRSIFSDGLQPMIARWQGYQKQITPLLKDLHNLSRQPEWKAYIAELITTGDEIPTQIQRHIRLWDSIASTCSS